MNKKIVGLDIRKDAVSAVLLKSSIKGCWIEGHAHAQTPDPNESFVRSLEHIAEKLDLSGAVCIACFPGHQINYRNLRVPFKGSKKIRQVLPFELEPTLPIPVENIVIDFQAVTLSDHTDLIAAAVEKSQLTAYIEILASYGIDPKTVTAGTFPTAYWLSRHSQYPDNFLLVDVGTRQHTLFAVAARQICLVRSFPAREGDPSHVESLCTNIRQTLLAAEEKFQITLVPESVYITGNGAVDGALSREMARRLDLSVTPTDLVRDAKSNINNHPSPDWKPEQMDNALAAALMEIEGTEGLNFRPTPLAAKKIWTENRNSLIKTAVAAGMVLLLSLFNVYWDKRQMAITAKRLDTEINTVFKELFPKSPLTDSMQQFKVIEQKAREVEKASKISGTGDSALKSIDILLGISQRVPQESDVDFDRLVYSQETVQITGDTNTFNAVDDIKNKLEAAEIFKKVTISSANMDKTGNE